MKDEDLEVPMRSFIIRKWHGIIQLINHRFTAEEIEEKLRRSGVLQTRYASLDRVDILKRRKAAIERGDEAAIAKCDADLAALEGPKLAFGTSLRKARGELSYDAAQQERLAALNRANRKANTHDVRKAQQAERRAEALARRAIERGEAVLNPMARVKIRAKIHHNVNRESVVSTGSGATADNPAGEPIREKSGSATPSSVAETKSPVPTSAPIRDHTPASSGEKITGLPRLGRRTTDEDVFAAMDFGIEIDF